jgi:hypothetical protein
MGRGVQFTYIIFQQAQLSSEMGPRRDLPPITSFTTATRLAHSMEVVGLPRLVSCHSSSSCLSLHRDLAKWVAISCRSSKYTVFSTGYQNGSLESARWPKNASVPFGVPGRWARVAICQFCPYGRSKHRLLPLIHFLHL